MKERNNSNVTFVMQTLDEKAIYMHMFQKSMKEGNNSNVTYVMIALVKRAL